MKKLIAKGLIKTKVRKVRSGEPVLHYQLDDDTFSKQFEEFLKKEEQSCNKTKRKRNAAEDFRMETEETSESENKDTSEWKLKKLQNPNNRARVPCLSGQTLKNKPGGGGARTSPHADHNPLLLESETGTGGRGRSAGVSRCSSNHAIHRQRGCSAILRSSKGWFRGATGFAARGGSITRRLGEFRTRFSLYANHTFCRPVGKTVARSVEWLFGVPE
jgi:hypothetical protein